MIKVEGVSRIFSGPRPVTALEEVSLRIERGERVALMGASGSGKSTLLNLIGGLDRPTGGSIQVDGVALEELDDDRRTRLRRDRIGFVFQFFNLLPTLRAWENVALPLHLAGWRRGPSRERALALLSEVELADRYDHLPDELSGGEQQRVARARALSLSPGLLLADEPTGNLDSRSGEGVLALLSSLNAKLGTTLLIATHDARVASACQRILTIVDGRIREEAAAGAHPAL